MTHGPDSVRAQPATIVEAKGLTVDFAAGRRLVRAVSGVDLSLQPGETLALLGESGSGKSVTLRSFLRLHPKSARIGGSDAGGRTRRAGDVGCASSPPIAARSCR